jgi:gas vesicle protein
MWIGTGLGILAVISGVVVTVATGGALGLVALAAAGGLATGAITGGAAGLIGGGIRGMDRQTRKEKYADDLMKKAKAKSQPQPQADYRNAHKWRQRRNDYVFDRLLQQGREITDETSHYFRNMVHGSRGNGHGQGF